MKVAVIQFKPALGDRVGNLMRLTDLVVKAAEAGASICVCPELCTTGYSFMSREEAETYAEILIPGESLSLDLFTRLSQYLGVYIAWGVMEKSQATGALYNSQVLVSPDSSFLTYAKANHFGNDWLWSTAGSENPPIAHLSIDGDRVKAGLLICRDIRDKSDTVDSFYEPGDCDLVLASCAWGRGAFPATAWMNFVKDNRLTLCVSNVYGTESNNDFGLGGVAIIKPDLSVNCEGLVWGKDCIVCGDV
jgi:predicted amidohydrolase